MDEKQATAVRPSKKIKQHGQQKFRMVRLQIGVQNRADSGHRRTAKRIRRTARTRFPKASEQGFACEKGKQLPLVCFRKKQAPSGTMPKIFVCQESCNHQSQRQGNNNQAGFCQPDCPIADVA